MKLDVKSWLIVVLLGFSLFFFYMWYFRGPSTKDDIKSLKSDIIRIQKERDSLANARVILQKDFDILKNQDSLRSVEISNLDNNLITMQSQLDKTKSDFDKVRKDFEDSQLKFNQLKNTPPNRTGNDLINSIKNKTK